MMRLKLFYSFLILLLTILGTESLQAQTLVITQKGGSKVSFNLDEMPKTTFTTDELVITTNTATFSYPLANISRYTYEGGTLSISDTEAQHISIMQNGTEIVVVGLPAGKTATIFNVDGKQLLSKTSDGSYLLTLSINNFPIGVYVVKAEEVTYKIRKR